MIAKQAKLHAWVNSGIFLWDVSNFNFTLTLGNETCSSSKEQN